MRLEAALTELTTAVNENTALLTDPTRLAGIAARPHFRAIEAASGAGFSDASSRLPDAETVYEAAGFTSGQLQALCSRYLFGLTGSVEEAAARRAKVRAAMAHLNSNSVYYLFEPEDRLRLYAYLTCWMSGIDEFELGEVDQRLRDGWSVAAIRDGLSARKAVRAPEDPAPGGAPDVQTPDVSVGPYSEAILRHLSGWWDGERLCAGTRIHHLAHIVACCAILIHAEAENLLIDDRDLVLADVKRLLAAFPPPRDRSEAYVDKVHMDLSELWLSDGSFYVSSEVQFYPVWG